MSLLICMFVALWFHHTKCFEWKSKEDIQSYFTNEFGPTLAKYMKGDASFDEFASALRIDEDFEEYFLSKSVIGFENWKKYVIPLNGITKEAYAMYDIDLWDKRQALISFIYVYTFHDDSTIIGRGFVSALWNINGNLSKWTYHSKGNSLKAVEAKFIDILQNNEKNDL